MYQIRCRYYYGMKEYDPIMDALQKTRASIADNRKTINEDKRFFRGLRK